MKLPPFKKVRVVQSPLKIAGKSDKYTSAEHGKWTTQQGHTIWIPELEDSHLKNIWNLIKNIRQAVRVGAMRAAAESLLRGDAALDSIQEHFDENGDSTDGDDIMLLKHTHYDYIKKEMEKRGFEAEDDVDEEEIFMDLEAENKRMSDYGLDNFGKIH